MKIYRGPRTKPSWDDKHEIVSFVSPEKLEASIKDGSYIRFNISKDATERRAVCTAHFESEDIVPMITGLLSRLKAQQLAFLGIKKLMQDEKLSNDKKLAQIGEILKEL